MILKYFSIELLMAGVLYMLTCYFSSKSFFPENPVFSPDLLRYTVAYDIVLHSSLSSLACNEKFSPSNFWI